MRSLQLTGHLIDMRSQGGKFITRELNGGEWHEHSYDPKNVDFENVVIANPNGNITLSAINWLSKNNIPILMLDYKGELMSMMDMPITNAKTRMRQYDAYQNDRVKIGKQFIEGKIRHTEDFVNWLSKRYEIDIQRFSFKESYQKLKDSTSIKGIMGIEGMAANIYWSELTKVFAETKLPMGNRDIGRTNRPMNAVDEINAMLNYGYVYIESLIQKALIGNGLDPCIGFLHEVASGKRPLTYDFVEPFRFLVDWSIIKGLESNVFNKKDFSRDIGTYTIRMRKNGLDKLLRLIQESLSTRVRYKNAEWQWYTIIYDKAREFSKDFKADFENPSFESERTDTKDMREKILKMSYAEWKRMGYSKGTLWYMKHNIEKGNFKLYEKSLEKL